MTIRGGGHPKQAMVLTPVSRMGPPPRSFAADAHDCIMVRSLWTYRIQGCGAMLRARWQAPPRTALLSHQKNNRSTIEINVDKKCPIQGLLGVHSRYGLHTRAVTVYRDMLSEGFSHFVTSMTAPVASGWSDLAGWGLHPLESAALSRRTQKAVLGRRRRLRYERRSG